MGIQNEDMSNYGWINDPEVGDVIMTKPIRVSKNKIYSTNPTNWGGFVIIEKNNLEVIFSDDVIKYIKKGESFRLNKEEYDEWPARIKKKQLESGHIFSELLSEEEIKNRGENKDENRTVFDSPNRQEPIVWEGTQQTINPEAVKQREEVFGKQDLRGDKNDLLGGHM
jgi:hypothetical protein